MIKKNRDDVDTPGVLATDSIKAIAEKYGAEVYYQQNPSPDKAFPFKVYKNDEIKTLLEQLFKEKCAYCETRYASSQPVDVEHFRPKGEIILEEGPTLVPGYWWLAATWENLLPSCIHCNRRSKHLLPSGEVRVIGKGNYFPLAAGQLHARVPGDELGETPLLINPTLENPDQHLEFVDDLLCGSPYSIVKAKSVNGTVSNKGSKSIEYYALNRNSLVKERVELLKRLSFALNQVERSIKRIESEPLGDEGKATILKTINDDIAEIRNLYLNKEAIYSAAANAFYRRWSEQVNQLVQL